MKDKKTIIVKTGEPGLGMTYLGIRGWHKKPQKELIDEIKKAKERTSVKLDYDDPIVKRYRQGKDPKGIKGSVAFINDAPTGRAPYGGWYNVYADKYGVSSGTIRTHVTKLQELIRKRERT